MYVCARILSFCVCAMLCMRYLYVSVCVLFKMRVTVLAKELNGPGVVSVRNWDCGEKGREEEEGRPASFGVYFTSMKYFLSILKLALQLISFNQKPWEQGRT